MHVCAKIDVNVSVKYSFLLIIWLSSQIISMLPVACLCAQMRCKAIGCSRLQKQLISLQLL